MGAGRTATDGLAASGLDDSGALVLSLHRAAAGGENQAAHSEHPGIRVGQDDDDDHQCEGVSPFGRNQGGGALGPIHG